MVYLEKTNINGTPIKDIDPSEFCPMCERMVMFGRYVHYSNCPLVTKN